MSYKAVESWDMNEVAMWMNCIGLGEKVGAFRENTVDGDLLLSLNLEDLTGDLGLTRLQSKKFLKNLKFAERLAASCDEESGGSGDKECSERVGELEGEVRSLKKLLAERDASIEDLGDEEGVRKMLVEKEGRVEELEGEGADMLKKVEKMEEELTGLKDQLSEKEKTIMRLEDQLNSYKGAVSKGHEKPEKTVGPTHKPSSPGVVGGAAVGAAGGAMKGALVGAILPGMDAGDGAAAGAALGALGGGTRGLGRRFRR